MFSKGFDPVTPRRKEHTHMRRTFLALAVSMVLAAFSGCASNCCCQGGACQSGGCHLAPGAGYGGQGGGFGGQGGGYAGQGGGYDGQGVCQNGCPNGGLGGCLHCGMLGHRGAGDSADGGGGGGSNAGTVSYPYYTLRGPRDFLETHPQSIGP
jgi:hypothetical protein